MYQECFYLPSAMTYINLMDLPEDWARRPMLP